MGSSDGVVDLSQYMEKTVLHLRKEIPLEIAVATFQQLVGGRTYVLAICAQLIAVF